MTNARQARHKHSLQFAKSLRILKHMMILEIYER